MSNSHNGSHLHLTSHLCGQVSATPQNYFGYLFACAQNRHCHPALCNLRFSLVPHLQVSGPTASPPETQENFLGLLLRWRYKGSLVQPCSWIPTPFLFKPNIKMLRVRFGPLVPLVREVSYLIEYLWLYMALQQHDLSLTKPHGIFSISHFPFASNSALKPSVTMRSANGHAVATSILPSLPHLCEFRH